MAVKPRGTSALGHPTSRDRAGSFVRCRAGSDVDDACNGLMDDLLAVGQQLPSVYLLVDGRLRCRGARGYFQVVDGFTPGGGVIGRAVLSGITQVVTDVSGEPDFIAAIPGLRAEVCAPILDVDGTVLGAVNVESRTTLRPDAPQVLEDAAAALAGRIRELGGMPQPSLGQRLARIAVELTTATDVAAVELRTCAAAVELSGMSSAMIARYGPGDLGVSAVHGPLAPDLAGWSRADLEAMAGWVSAGTSSHFPGGEDVPAGYEFLRQAGIRAVSVHPLVVGGHVNGVLVTAARSPVRHSPAVVEALELLSSQAAATLGVATAMEELHRRASEDALTGLGNPAAFAADLKESVVPDGLPADTVLLLLDIDRFKTVNDTHGHLAGDRLLQALAAELRAGLRESDRLYRIGGDEFAALIRVTRPGEAAAAAERALAAARRCRTTLSIGSAPATGDPDSVRRLADAALYTAKAAGRDTARHA